MTEGLQVEVKNVQAEEKHICCSDSTVSVIEQSESLKTSNEQWADICTEFVTKNSETVLEQNSAIELDCSVAVTEGLLVEVNGSRLVYLDNAATSQKPQFVIDAVREYYEAYNANVHRGIHFLSAKATDEYELARKKLADFINASGSREIVFTRNATEAINLVAYSWGLTNLKAGDEVCLSPYYIFAHLYPHHTLFSGLLIYGSLL